MPKIIEKPTEIKACGNREKIISEFIGIVNSGTEQLSIAKMESLQGWEEAGQMPLFDEYTVVLKGVLKIETKEKSYDISEGQAVIINKNEWVKYSTPYEGGAEYIAVCLPAFSPKLVNRDKEG